MKRKLVFFVLGIALFIASLPMATSIAMEINHNREMNEAYDITKVGLGEPYNTSRYNFNGHTIEIKEVMKVEESHTEVPNYQIGLADLTILVNGEVIHELPEHPIRVEEEGLHRYFGEVSYLILEDREKLESQFIVLLKTTRELDKVMPNGDIVDWVPIEELEFALYAIDEEGDITNTSFSVPERTELQSELLHASNLLPYSIGYHTDALEGYPSIIFPIFYPYITLLLGFIMTIFNLPFRIRRK